MREKARSLKGDTVVSLSEGVGNERIAEYLNSYASKVSVLESKLERSERILHNIVDGKYNDLAGDPNSWSCTDAMRYFGWTWEDGKAIPPKEENESNTN